MMLKRFFKKPTPQADLEPPQTATNPIKQEIGVNDLYEFCKNIKRYHAWFFSPSHESVWPQVKGVNSSKLNKRLLKGTNIVEFDERWDVFLVDGSIFTVIEKQKSHEYNLFNFELYFNKNIITTFDIGASGFPYTPLSPEFIKNGDWELKIYDCLKWAENRTKQLGEIDNQRLKTSIEAKNQEQSNKINKTID
jgi:hypothetical protein